MFRFDASGYYCDNGQSCLSISRCPSGGGEVEINVDPIFSAPTKPVFSKYSALHEWGHAALLAHDCVSGAVMEGCNNVTYACSDYANQDNPLCPPP